MTESCECHITLADPVRFQRFKGIFPGDAIPIESPVVQGEARTGPETYLYYKLALGRVTDEQRKLIHQRIGDAFDLPPEIVKDQMEQNGCPIKADQTILSICQRHSRMLI